MFDPVSAAPGSGSAGARDCPSPPTEWSCTDPQLGGPADKPAGPRSPDSRPKNRQSPDINNARPGGGSRPEVERSPPPARGLARDGSIGSPLPAPIPSWSSCTGRSAESATLQIRFNGRRQLRGSSPTRLAPPSRRRGVRINCN